MLLQVFYFLQTLKRRTATFQQEAKQNIYSVTKTEYAL